MPVAVLFCALAAGLIAGDASNGGGTEAGWIVAGVICGLLGLARLLGYLAGLQLLSEAKRELASEEALIGTTTYRAPGEGTGGWRLPMALLGLVGAVAGGFAGYAVHEALRGGSSLLPALAGAGAFVAFACSLARRAVLPDDLSEAMDKALKRRQERARSQGPAAGTPDPSDGDSS